MMQALQSLLDVTLQPLISFMMSPICNPDLPRAGELDFTSITMTPAPFYKGFQNYNLYVAYDIPLLLFILILQNEHPILPGIKV